MGSKVQIFIQLQLELATGQANLVHDIGMGFEMSGRGPLDELVLSSGAGEASKESKEEETPESFQDRAAELNYVGTEASIGDREFEEGTSTRGDSSTVPPNPDGQAGNIIVLESCNSTWVFDTEKSRFRRVLKGPDVENSQAATDWRPYYGLELDDESEYFAVSLNKAGTRILRSWRHLDHCHLCGGEATTELSLDDLRSAILG